MLSAWSKSADLYLGQGVALLGASAREATEISFPSTLPIEQALERVYAAASEVMVRGTKLRLRLSASLCPPVAFVVPPGVRHWRDLEELARVKVAADRGGLVDDYSVDVCVSHPGLAACLPLSWVNAITSWAKRHHMRLASIQPMWAAASGCGLVREQLAGGLALFEPDGCTALVVAADATTHSWHIAEGKFDEAAKLLKRWLASEELLERPPVKLSFSLRSGDSLPGGPNVFAGHWGKA